MITCASCGRTVDGDVADDTPCPTCGTPLLAGKPVELDPAWIAEKQAKADAHAAATAPRKPRRGRWLLGAVTVAMIGVIVAMVIQRQPAVRGAAVGDVEITVVAPKPGTPVIVDGAPAGTTPLVLRMPSSKTPIKIVGNLTAIVVVPDRDRTVHLVRPAKPAKP